MSAKATTLTARHLGSSTASLQTSTTKNSCRSSPWSSPWTPPAHSDMWWQHAILTRQRGQPLLLYGPLQVQDLYSCTKRGRRQPTKRRQRHIQLLTPHLPNGCPATEAMCSCCGKTGHWSNTQGCPARNAQCRVCNRYGNFDQLCRTLQPKQRSKPKNTKQGTERHSTFHMVRAQLSLGNPKPPKQQASLRRVESTVCERPMPSPTISVVVTHTGVSENIDVIPDTDADFTVIGLQHLKSLGFSKSDLTPAPTLAYYNADGSKMLAALGSFQAKLTYGACSLSGCTELLGFASVILGALPRLRHSARELPAADQERQSGSED